MSKNNGKSILITGGAGFIGYHLAHQLSQNAADTLVLVDNFMRGKRDDDFATLVTRPNIRLISADLADPATYQQLGSDYDEVYHLAAIIGVQNVLKRPHEVLRVNGVATGLLVEWFVNGGGKKLLLSSTSEAYAWTQQFHPLPIPTPEAVPLALTDIHNPRSSYAGSKIFAELLVTHYCSVYNKPYTIVRYHNVYGPRMGYEHVIPQLYERAYNGEDPLTVYSANYSRAFCYVSDAVAATISAMRVATADGRTLNIGNDEEEITIETLAQQILAKAKLSGAINPQTAQNDPIARRCPDLTQARALLDYQPQVTLDQGLAKTLAWYAKQFAKMHSNG